MDKWTEKQITLMELSGNHCFRDYLKTYLLERPDYQSDLAEKYKRELDEKVNKIFDTGYHNTIDAITPKIIENPDKPEKK